jgi:translocation and assembly module TamB
VKGAVDARNPSKWSASVNISGKNIRFMNTNEIRATMTPNLTIELNPKVMAFKGKVIIPEASINLKKIPELSIDESEDVIVLGEKKKGEQVSALKIHPNVLVELGDKVKLNAFGLRAKLSGRVNITHNRRDVLAQGSLKVTDGKYQAYGQNLDINNGRLIFNGSPKLVGMDIRATRKVDNTLVGVHLGGTVLKPKSKIFSDPSLPDSEALSLLLTGHTLSTASGQESALLMSAVRGLGVAGSDSLLNNIGSSLGLDDVNIVTKEDFRKSELALGKRLGSRLYVRYIVGLFDQAQKIAIDYKINRFLSLQAETSTEGNYGLDFIYKIERD